MSPGRATLTKFTLSVSVSFGASVDPTSIPPERPQPDGNSPFGVGRSLGLQSSDWELLDHFDHDGSHVILEIAAAGELVDRQKKLLED